MVFYLNPKNKLSFLRALTASTLPILIGKLCKRAPLFKSLNCNTCLQSLI
ncbi:hypothetical protein HanPI659440_Chr05g0199891 [Helianthus annuus]|nr:hypothetical protein HanPI659440_Chr05g0199891 [Helianthus annuus]